MTQASSAFTAVEIWTDGSCEGNPGPGGWAAIATGVNAEGERVEIDRRTGGNADTTNNRMELDAAIAALEMAQAGGWPAVTICADSEYVVKGAAERMARWKANGWRTADKKPVKNRDRWEALDSLNDPSRVSWRHVRGHQGIQWNELADQAADTAVVYPDGSAYGFEDETKGCETSPTDKRTRQYMATLGVPEASARRMVLFIEYLCAEMRAGRLSEADLDEALEIEARLAVR